MYDETGRGCLSPDIADWTRSTAVQSWERIAALEILQRVFICFDIEQELGAKYDQCTFSRRPLSTS